MSVIRRTPVQKRGLDRVERILEVASALIADAGSDAMKMSEVAVRADVSIGSLYQYFPDKSAIIRRLAERYNHVGRRCIADGLSEGTDLDSFLTAFDALIDTYYGIFLDEPVMRDIWSGAQADKSLRDFQLEESRLNGAIVADAMERLRPGQDRARLEASALTIMHLGEEAMRLAISVNRPEGEAFVAAYKRMAQAELLDAVRG